MKKDTIFWDVDTQFDFMQPHGKLYVPGAEHIIDKVSQTRRFALENGCSIIADVDWHSTDDTEISEAPDFKQTFPPHCMAGQAGSQRVGCLGELPIEYVQTGGMETSALQKLIDKDQFHIVIKKNTIDVFSNLNADKLIKLINPRKVFVFGVALDFCVYYVLRGLHNALPDIELCLLKDVTRGLGVRPEGEILDEFRQMGIEIAELSDIRRKIVCG